MNFFLASPRTRQRDFLKGMRKNVYFQFLWFANTFSSNLNIMNLKIFSKHGEMYMFNRKFNNSIGGLGKFQVKSVSFFVFLFCFFSWSQKENRSQKISWTALFLSQLLDPFDLPSFNSELWKRYTLRMLLCLRRQAFWKFFCLGGGGKRVSW